MFTQYKYIGKTLLSIDRIDRIILIELLNTRIMFFGICYDFRLFLSE